MRNFSKKYILISAAVILTLVIGGYFVFHDPVIAKVGDVKISKKEAQYRDQVIRLYFPEEKRLMGMYQLIKSAYNLEVLKNNSVYFQDAQIDQEEKRIEQNTKRPQQLKQIKDIFGADHEAYRRVFVLPTLVDRYIYFDFFTNNEKIHSESLHAAHEFIQEVGPQGEKFRSFAQKNGLQVIPLKISLNEGLSWGPDDGVASNASKEAKKRESKKADPKHIDEEAKKWYDLLIKNLKEGEVATIPIDRDEVWLVAHYLRQKTPTLFELEVVPFRKSEFGPWFETEKAKIKLEVYDKTLPVP